MFTLWEGKQRPQKPTPNPVSESVRSCRSNQQNIFGSAWTWGKPNIWPFLIENWWLNRGFRGTPFSDKPRYLSKFGGETLGIYRMSSSHHYCKAIWQVYSITKPDKTTHVFILAWPNSWNRMEKSSPPVKRSRPLQDCLPFDGANRVLWSDGNYDLPTAKKWSAVNSSRIYCVYMSSWSRYNMELCGKFSKSPLR